MVLSWGILCTGLISHDFCVGFSTLPPEEHQLVAVAARNLDSAEKFAQAHKIPKAYGSYEELVKDPNIDIVYIGAITSQHLPLSKLCLNNGKHILTEKPLCVNVKETKELIALAKEKKLFLMEGIWSRHFPAYHKLQEELNKGSIGEVLQVVVTFGIQSSPQGYRLKPRENGTGTMLDIGIYAVQLASLVYGGEKPEKIVAAGELNEDGVDKSTSSTLIYSKGRTATIITHSSVDLPNEGIIVGTQGTIKVPFPFWSPNKLETPTKTYEFELPKASEKPILLNSEALCYQCVEAKRCVQNGLTESPFLLHSESLTISEIMESIRKQVGVVYIQD